MNNKQSTNSLEEFLNVLREHEIKTFSKFVCIRSQKAFTEEKFTPNENTKIHWNGAVPHINIGCRVYACHQGKDKNLYQKKRYAEKRDSKACRDHDFTERRKLAQPTKKLDCPVVINVYRVLALPRFKVRKLNVTCVRNASMIKPPVAVFGVEGRYATALYSAAMKEKKIDSIEKDMVDLKVLLAKDVRLFEFIMNPLLQVNVKMDALKKAFGKKSYSPLTLNLIMCMAENGRLKSLVSVINCFNGVMSTIRGEVSCEIVTAKPLDAPTLAEFEKTLKKFVQKNEKVFLKTKVDPSLIGGAIITIGDKYVDMSIASKIKAYNSVLREIV